MRVPFLFLHVGIINEKRIFYLSLHCNYFTGTSSANSGTHSTKVYEALTSGYAKTALGRRRYLDQVIGKSNSGNKIKNFPIQGTAADGFKIVLCRLDEKFKALGLDAHLFLTLHDEIVLSPERMWRIKLWE